MSILIFDTDKTELKMFEKILRGSGYHDCIYESALDKVIEILDLGDKPRSGISVGIDLMLLDLAAGPELYAVIDSLKTDQRYRDIPIVVISKGDFNQEVLTAYAFGASDYLKKPFHTGEVKARIHACLRLCHEINRRKAREKELNEIAYQLKDLNQVLTRMSLIDSLTGVANRRAFDQTLDQEFKRGKRNEKPISVLIFDVDYFKSFNDTYGHQAGDHCLKCVASEVQQAIRRPGDMLSRYGGEEFAIVLPDTDSKGAIVIGQKMLTSVANLDIIHEASSVAPTVTISVGAATQVSYQVESDPMSLLKKADEALYKAKRSGRNKVCHEVIEETSPKKTA